MTADPQVVEPTVLDVEDLSVDYGRRRALSGVNLSIEAGSTLAVIGPNGSGKSTFLHAVAGLVASSGRIRCDRSDLALVLQSTEIDANLPLTVRDVVRMARYAHAGLLRRLTREDNEAVSHALERVDLSSLAQRQIHELSGGQRQRVLVAQGLAQVAGLLLLDEPMTGLDIVSKSLIVEAVAAERAAGRSVVLTTHDLEEARRCDRVLLVSTSPVAFGRPAEVIVESNLRKAFGGKVVRLDDGEILMDDPHHDHQAHH